MIEITLETIEAAKNNDLSAVTEVVRVTDERVVQLARKYATTGGRTDADLAEDLAQIGRIAVWESLSRFQGATAAELFTFVDRTVSGKLADERKMATRQGVSLDTAKWFEHALTLASGDPYEAEKIAQDVEIMGRRRLSKDMAYAARLSWQGIDSIDAPYVGDVSEGNHSYAERIPATYGLPEDLIESEDLNRGHREETRKAVRNALGKMGDIQANVLRGTYGIAPAPFELGTENEDLLADWAGVARDQVRSRRTKAKISFRKVYLAGAGV